MRAHVIPVVACLAVLSVGGAAWASTGPQWRAAQLIDFADVIVTGRVEAVSSGWDPGVDVIYSYVTVNVDEVFKGSVATERVTLKQLGGLAGEIGLFIADQAVLEPGEDVLLFLEVRPRDGTLYTSALSQGKWNVTTLENGERVAVGGADILPIQVLRAAAGAPVSTVVAPHVRTSPAEVTSHQAFSLMATPYRYTFFPPVDVQAGGQPGLADGGFAEIQRAIARWHSTGASFRFLAGSSGSMARCAGEFLGNYRVTISFLDPCGEISNNGGTIAIGGSYFTTSSGITANNQFFRIALEGFIVNNDSPVALRFLSVPGCFEDVQLHELGHVLGLGHSTDPRAIMFPSLSSDCMRAPNGLAADDVEAIRFVYPPGQAGTPGQSTVTRVSASEEIVTVEWSSSSGAAPTSHRLDFFSGTAHVVSLMVGATTRVDLPIPRGTRGVFGVRITPFSQETPGPASDLVTFAIGTVCTSPLRAPEVAGAVMGENAVVSWQSVPGATSYVLQAGRTRGGADLVPATDVGNVTSVAAAGLPSGFTAWVRVTAINACGRGASTDYFVQ